MPSKVWDEITYPFPTFNGCTVEDWEWIRNFIPQIIIGVIYLSMLGLKFNHVSKRGPVYDIYIIFLFWMIYTSADFICHVIFTICYGQWVSGINLTNITSRVGNNFGYIQQYIIQFWCVIETTITTHNIAVRYVVVEKCITMVMKTCPFFTPSHCKHLYPKQRAAWNSATEHAHQTRPFRRHQYSKRRQWHGEWWRTRVGIRVIEQGRYCLSGSGGAW